MGIDNENGKGNARIDARPIERLREIRATSGLTISAIIDLALDAVEGKRTLAFVQDAFVLKQSTRSTVDVTG